MTKKRIQSQSPLPRSALNDIENTVMVARPNDLSKTPSSSITLEKVKQTIASNGAISKQMAQSIAATVTKCGMIDEKMVNMDAKIDRCLEILELLLISQERSSNPFHFTEVISGIYRKTPLLVPGVGHFSTANLTN